MRTMASVWLLLVIALVIEDALGNEMCQKVEKITNCNDCMRCGAKWCSQNGGSCHLNPKDDWCGGNQEEAPIIEDEKEPGKEFNYVSVLTTAVVGKTNDLTASFKSTVGNKPFVQLKILNSTQTKQIDIANDNYYCDNVGDYWQCSTNIKASPSENFCLGTGTTDEFVSVKMHVENVTEELLLSYHVPCACECSKKIEKASPKCHGNGDLSCGACSCYSHWYGPLCNSSTPLDDFDYDPDSTTRRMIIPTEKPYCPHPQRGDVTQCDKSRPYEGCNGNGYCDPCERCVCYDNVEGSQYFDGNNSCSDICMLTTEYEDCISSRTIGKCDSYNDFIITVQTYNESLVDEIDHLNRKVWVGCNVTIDDCNHKYLAKKDFKDNMIYVMVSNFCDPIAEAAATPVKVPIIMGVLGLIAAVAAVGGIMLWKHMNALPPVNPNTPGYTNIDAEECVGENPLYKCPTSSYKNPMFGKL